MSVTLATRQLNALTGIRGLAAWAVVLFHVRMSVDGLLPPIAITVLGKGSLAVDLFFVLSGFVMWLNYVDRLRDGRGEVVKFFWRRFARVWPLHAVVLMGFAGLALVLAATGRNHDGYPLAELPLHLFLMQNWGFTNTLTWNHPAWSISTEWAAYLIFPLIVLPVRWERVPVWLVLGVILTLAGMITAAFALNGVVGIGDDIPRMGLWRAVPEFAMGCLIAVLWKRWHASGKGRMGSLATAVALFIAGIALRLPDYAWMPLLFCAVLLALALDTGPLSRALGSPLIKYLGEISYSTYLAHFGLFIVFKMLFVDQSAQMGWGQLLGFLALVALVSVILYHSVEKPAQRWLNAHTPRFATHNAVLPAG